MCVARIVHLPPNHNLNPEKVLTGRFRVRFPAWHLLTVSEGTWEQNLFPFFQLPRSFGSKPFTQSFSYYLSVRIRLPRLFFFLYFVVLPPFDSNCYECFLFFIHSLSFPFPFHCHFVFFCIRSVIVCIRLEYTPLNTPVFYVLLVIEKCQM